jgi:pimeloyl-ACP methyl ester carboxylesterase
MTSGEDRQWRSRTPPGDVTQLCRRNKEGNERQADHRARPWLWGGAAHWAKVIVELNQRGYDSLHAVENPLTSVSDDAERTQKMIKQVDGPVLLVGHSYGGAVITQAGDLPNVVGLVYVAHASLASQPVAIADLIDRAATSLT